MSRDIHSYSEEELLAMPIEYRRRIARARMEEAFADWNKKPKVISANKRIEREEASIRALRNRQPAPEPSRPQLSPALEFDPDDEPF